MKVLLLNSDLAKNRGDRIIAEGVIALCKKYFPEAEITGISEKSARDKEWFEINFLKMDAQSINPLDLIKLLKEAKKSDFILWGGGELLKDYTNIFALFYWAFKIRAVGLFNKNMYGAYQGIGPTRFGISKRLIVWAVNQTKLFITREKESREKLERWGVRTKIIDASDPAIYVGYSINSFTYSEKNQLEKIGLNEDVLNNFAAVGPRKWFHYKKSGLLPFKYRAGVRKAFGLKQKPNHQLERYKKSLVEIVNQMIEENKEVILIPMHMGVSEADAALCSELKNQSTDKKRVHILNEDSISPQLLRKIVSKAKYFVGFRLHSTIMSASTLVPSLNYYYVDKGRQFFEQIGMEEFSAPIESLLEPDFGKKHRKMIAALNNKQVRKDLDKRILKLKNTIDKSFGEIYEDTKK